MWLLCSWLQPIRTNDIHLSHISFSTKWGRRYGTFSIMGWQNKHRPRINARVTQQAAWSGGPMFVSGGGFRMASEHISNPSERPWAVLFITEGQLLPRSVPRPKHTHSISEQTAQCTEMLPALLPVPLNGWWVDPSQLVQLCPSPTISNQKRNRQRKLPCFFTLHLHLISLSLCCTLSKNQSKAVCPCLKIQTGMLQNFFRL